MSLAQLLTYNLSFNGSETVKTITHTLGTTDLFIIGMNPSTGEVIIPDVIAITGQSLQLSFKPAPISGTVYKFFLTTKTLYDPSLLSKVLTTDDVGVANGVAPLNADAIIPSEFLPPYEPPTPSAINAVKEYQYTIVGDGETEDFVIQHNLGSQDLFVQVVKNSTMEVVVADVTLGSSTELSVYFGKAPDDGEVYTVKVLKSTDDTEPIVADQVPPQPVYAVNSSEVDREGNPTYIEEQDGKALIRGQRFVVLRYPSGARDSIAVDQLVDLNVPATFEGRVELIKEKNGGVVPLAMQSNSSVPRLDSNDYMGYTVTCSVADTDAYKLFNDEDYHVLTVPTNQELYFQIDFPEAVTIRGFRYDSNFGEAPASASNIQVYAIEGYDGENWNILAERGVSQNEPSDASYKIVNPGSYQSYRFRVVYPNAGELLIGSLYLFEYFNDIYEGKTIPYDMSTTRAECGVTRFLTENASQDVVLSASTEAEGGQAFHCMDGNKSTAAIPTSSAEEYWISQLTQEEEIYTSMLLAGSFSGTLMWHVEGSSDGAIWNVLDEGLLTTDVLQTEAIPNDKAYRYHRVRLTPALGGNGRINSVSALSIRTLKRVDANDGNYYYANNLIPATSYKCTGHILTVKDFVPLGYVSVSKPSSIVPEMRGATAGSATAIGDEGNTHKVWEAFDGRNEQEHWWVSPYAPTTAAPQSVGVKFTSTQYVTGYYIETANIAEDATRAAPTNWTFEGSNNPDAANSWVVLDTQTQQFINNERAVRRFYQLQSSASYMAYRINITATAPSAYDKACIGEAGFTQGEHKIEESVCYALNNRYDSGWREIRGNVVSLRHNLGMVLMRPPLFDLRCNASEFGYAQGEVVFNALHGNTVKAAPLLSMDDDYVYINFTGGLSVYNRLLNDGTYSAINTSRWSYRVFLSGE